MQILIVKCTISISKKEDETSPVVVVKTLFRQKVLKGYILRDLLVFTGIRGWKICLFFLQLNWAIS